MWECKECGQENDDSFANCMSCGIEGGTKPPESPLQPVPEPAPKRVEPRSEWEVTRSIARVVSFVGWLIVVAGFTVTPFMLTATESGRELSGLLLWAVVAQMLTISVSGLVLVLIGHIARAVVDTTKNSGRIVEILESECGRPPDRTG